MHRLFVAVLLLAPLASHAQEAAAIGTVRHDPGFQTAAAQQFQNYESRLTTHCAVVSPDWARASHKVYGTPTVGGGGGLVNATWVETVPGTACGQSRRYRVLVAIRGGKASVAPLLPGDSYASPQLEHDAALPLAGATGAFVPKGKTCPVDILDTHLDGPEPVGKQPWRETWLVRTCDKRLTVPIQFVPDQVGEGTSIHIDSKAVLIAP